MTLYMKTNNLTSVQYNVCTVFLTLAAECLISEELEYLQEQNLLCQIKVYF